MALPNESIKLGAIINIKPRVKIIAIAPIRKIKIIETKDKKPQRHRISEKMEILEKIFPSLVKKLLK